MASTETYYVAAAGLIERLLTDETFRFRFRADPAATCRDHGLERLASEFERAVAPVVVPVGETASSLAGVLIASLAGSMPAASLTDLQGRLEAALAADPRALPTVQVA